MLPNTNREINPLYIQKHQNNKILRHKFNKIHIRSVCGTLQNSDEINQRRNK